jgi:hypothetical protein
METITLPYRTRRGAWVECGSHVIEMVHEPRCRVCRSPHREQIEKIAVEHLTAAVLNGKFRGHGHTLGYAATARLLPEAGLDRGAIQRHFDRGHHWFWHLTRTTLRRIFEEQTLRRLTGTSR